MPLCLTVQAKCSESLYPTCCVKQSAHWTPSLMPELHAPVCVGRALSSMPTQGLSSDVSCSILMAPSPPHGLDFSKQHAKAASVAWEHHSLQLAMCQCMGLPSAPSSAGARSAGGCGGGSGLTGLDVGVAVKGAADHAGGARLAAQTVGVLQRLHTHIQNISLLPDNRNAG